MLKCLFLIDKMPLRCVILQKKCRERCGTARPGGSTCGTAAAACAVIAGTGGSCMGGCHGRLAAPTPNVCWLRVKQFGKPIEMVKTIVILQMWYSYFKCGNQW